LIVFFRAGTAADVRALEEMIDAWEKELKLLKKFILPGGTDQAVWAHLIRTVTRRAEREVMALTRTAEVPPEVIQYLNRLSDLAFVLARVINKRAGVDDIEWKKR